MNTRTRHVVPVAAAALITATGFLIAGPLNPPGGPVTSTYKTLAEVEPRIAINAANTAGDADSLFKITQPGSYYLTGNIVGIAAKHGIEIVASDVALDLNGFELLGVPGTLDGVSATTGVQHVVVRNGTVRAWGDEGIDFTNGASIDVEGVGVEGCIGFAISVNTNSTVTLCRVTFNGAGGIATGSNCVVTGCTANGNTGAGGILAFVGCRVVDCTAMNNTGDGISANNASTIAGCSSNDNTSDGITVPNGCTISNCSASFNDVQGFNVGAGCTITDCTASSNFGSGINAGTGSTVSNCSTYKNAGHGIFVTTDSTVSNCTASDNAGSGIHVGNACTVADCTASSNTLDGIQCTARCIIRGNSCSSNGFGVGDGAGIRATLFDNRIDGNSCNNADRGIDVDTGSNIIIRNTCTGNTLNWTIDTGNSVGPIVVAGTNAVVISGNGPVASTLGSTDPNANFSY